MRQGYQLVIGVGFAQGDAIATAAKRFPEVKFAIVDYDHAFLKGNPPNAQGLLFREEQVGYLVGTLAALSRPARERVDGQRGRWLQGAARRPLHRRLPRRRRGGRARHEGVYAYSQDWEDQAKCKELALDQIAKGSKVVFQVAGGCGLGALSAAKDKGVWGIGVDADQSFLGPHILTSALKGVDQAVFLTVKAVQDGTWQGGGNAVFGLDQEGVGLGTVSDKVPQEDIDAVDDAEQKIADGEIADIPTTLGNTLDAGAPRVEADGDRQGGDPVTQLTDEQAAFLRQPLRRRRDDAPTDGSPHSTVVWVDVDDTGRRASTRPAAVRSLGTSRRPARDADRRRPEQRYPWLPSRDGAAGRRGRGRQIDKLAKKYLAPTRTRSASRMSAVTVRIALERIEAHGIDEE